MILEEEVVRQAGLAILSLVNHEIAVESCAVDANQIARGRASSFLNQPEIVPALSDDWLV